MKVLVIVTLLSVLAGTALATTVMYEGTTTVEIEAPSSLEEVNGPPPRVVLNDQNGYRDTFSVTLRNPAARPASFAWEAIAPDGMVVAFDSDTLTLGPLSQRTYTFEVGLGEEDQTVENGAHELIIRASRR